MKRMRWLVGLVVFGLSITVYAQDEEEKPTPEYVGAKTCAGFCHKTSKQGEQFRIWEESAHAKAYATLATDKAKEIAKAKGIADPQKSDACLKCHVTAHGVSEDLLTAKFSHEEGVGCESCHGPGSLYKKRSVMKDREKAMALGMVIPDAETCKQCHNEESPTYKPFDYEERWKQIAHPIPSDK